MVRSYGSHRIGIYLLGILHFACDIKLPTSLVCHSFKVFPSLQHFSQVCRNGDEHDATHSNAALRREFVVSIHCCCTAYMNRSRNPRTGTPAFRWNLIADKKSLNKTCRTSQYFVKFVFCTFDREDFGRDLCEVSKEVGLYDISHCAMCTVEHREQDGSSPRHVKSWPCLSRKASTISRRLDFHFGTLVPSTANVDPTRGLQRTTTSILRHVLNTHIALPRR